MEKNFLTLDKIDVYITAFDLNNYVWDLVIKWENFAKFTVGKQLVESADSISANVAEGFGGITKKIKLNFTDTVTVLYLNLLIG